MDFRVKKCVVFALKKANITNSNEIALPNEKTMKYLKEGDNCKYVGVIEAAEMEQHKMKALLQMDEIAING